MRNSLSGLYASLLMMTGAVTSAAPVRRRSRGDGFDLPLSEPARSRSKRYPQMVTAPDGEIRLWNDTVTTRQVLRSRIKPWKSSGQRAMWENRP